MRNERQTARRGKDIDRRFDERGPFERDLTRLIHSAAFRRLQAKTQVLGIGEGDFHRTRLTHSLEVANIARGIVRNLRYRSRLSKGSEPTEAQVKRLPDDDLIMFIGLAHDLGHPPFGHGGEVALNYCMSDEGGFEGNGQTLRILSKWKERTEEYGLNSTRRSLLGILKYPVNYKQLRKLDKTGKKSASRLSIKAEDWRPPKCYHEEEKDVVEWILDPFSKDDKSRFVRFRPPTSSDHGKSTEKCLDVSILDLADDIAYGIHDLEDAIALRLIDRDEWQQTEKLLDPDWMKEHDLKSGVGARLFGNSSERKRMVGALVHAFITNTETTSDRDYQSSLLRLKVEFKDRTKEDKSPNLEKIQDLVKNKVIHVPEV